MKTIKTLYVLRDNRNRVHETFDESEAKRLLEELRLWGKENDPHNSYFLDTRPEVADVPGHKIKPTKAMRIL